jgi:hypothetical protein
MIDQGLYMVLKRKAKKLGLKIGPQDRAALKMSEVEKDELITFAPSIMPYVAQYADLIGKLSLALFGLALYTIYETKADLLAQAAALQAEKMKQAPGFGARVQPGNGAAFDPLKVPGIPVHSPGGP